MAKFSLDRRDVLMGGAGLALAGSLPAVGRAAAAAKLKYDPAAKFDVKVTEIPYRKNDAGRTLMARIYQPVGPGPFPTVLDLHGGAWNTKNRTAEEPFDRSLASSGALIIAIDMTLAPEKPYPACIQDANFAVRWIKANAAKWNGDVSKLGVFGSSSGGHVAEMLAMRPHDARYNAIKLAGAPTDASVHWVAMRSPISNTMARYENAVTMKNNAMMKNNTTFFVPWQTIHESNPQEILDRKEPIGKLPFLIMQGALDDNMRPAFQQKFVNSYKAAGGKIDFTIFEGCVHEWVAKPGPQTDRAHAMVKSFIARQINA